MWHAWKNRSLDEYPTMKTEHEGLATRVPFEMPSRILWELLDDFLLVTDDEINEAIRLLAVNAKQIAEGAGAASLAGAIKLRDQLRGKKVVRDSEGLIKKQPPAADELFPSRQKSIVIKASFVTPANNHGLIYFKTFAVNTSTSARFLSVAVPTTTFSPSLRLSAVWILDCSTWV